METIVLSIISTLFAGTSIYQLLSIRSLKKKAKAEASQEGAKADGLNLGNIKDYIAIQDERLLQTTKERDDLAKELREVKWTLEDHARKINGLENTVNKEFTARKFAQKHICLNLPCTIRMPELGTYNGESNEKEGM